MLSLEEALEEVERLLDELKKKTLENIRELEVGEIAEMSLSGWVKRESDSDYRIGIWRGFGKAKGIEEYLRMVEEYSEFVELFAKSLSPTRIKILLLAYDGITEGELSEKLKLRGGALHYHLRDLLALGLLKKERRGYYITTKYGNFVSRTAISAIRKFKESLRRQEE